MKTFKFTGYKSGDNESFCFDVFTGDFIRITGESPEDFDESNFNDGIYRIYPEDLLNGLVKPGELYDFEITIKATKID